MTWRFRSGARTIEFGEAMSGLGLVEYPSVEYSMVSDVSQNPRGDGSRFGSDFIPSQTVKLLVEARPDERPLDEVWRELVAVWRADDVRQTPGARAVLEADTGRVAFGRPRPMSPDFQHKLFGISAAELVFEAADDLWYGPEELTRIRFVQAASGGLLFPAEAPFFFDGEPTVRNSSVMVGGDVSTWPVFEVAGPVMNPSVEVVGVGTLVFDVTLAYDEFLRVDTRPWARWVQRGRVQNPSELVPAPGVLSPSGSRLSDMSLRPGVYSILLRGIDTTGTAELGVIRNPAYTSF